jgi:flagellar hook assembly protein FlgD
VFVDKELAPGNYLYRLKQIDLDGTFVFLHEVTTSIGPPATFALHTNFPNPFNPATTISFDVPMTATIDLQVFDLNGHLVRTLLHEEREPGRHRLVWDGKNANGEGSASGIYLVRLKSGDFVKTIRATLMK